MITTFILLMGDISKDNFNSVASSSSELVLRDAALVREGHGKANVGKNWESVTLFYLSDNTWQYSQALSM